MALSDAFHDKKFDSRLIDQNIKNGTLTESEREQYLNSLPDCAEQAVSFKLFEESTKTQENHQSSENVTTSSESGGYVNGNGGHSSFN